MTDRPKAVGQARTVLVFGAGEDAVAVMSTIEARPLNMNPREPLRFTGPVAFEAAAADHLREVVVPLVGQMVMALSLPMSSFELSVANVGAASVQDIGVHVSGFSADTAVFLASVSAALGLPLATDFVSTGHIGSSAGEIRMVRSLKEKLDAADADAAVRLFLYPTLDADASLAHLIPTELGQIRSAVTGARKKLRTAAVENIADLLKSTLDDEDVVAAALRNNYFYLEERRKAGRTPLERAIGFLYEDMERRFWACLERGLLGGENGVTASLLGERFRFHSRLEAYPAGLGAMLHRDVQSLPPTTRRRKTRFPLVPAGEALGAGRLAKASDFDDVRKLYAAVSGEGFAGKRVPEEEPAAPEAADDAAAAFEHALAQIAPETLAREVGLPIDTARACYVMDTVIVDNDEEFDNIISAFYLHLMSHTRGLERSLSAEQAGPDSLALLERALERMGGVVAAKAEGRDGVHGGMRFILDSLTAQFKKENQEKHVNAVLKQAIGSLDWGHRVGFMTALIGRLRPHLSPEIDTSTPERFVPQCEPIMREYVASLERVNQLLRAM